MGFYRQFDEFDPLTGEALNHPFAQLPSIVLRARELLKGRTRDELVSAAHTADWFIEEYFRCVKDDHIRRLLDRGGWELGYLPDAERNEAGIRRLLENWPSDADDPPPHLPNPENTSEVAALKECIDWYELDDDPEMPNSRDYEYFAVLALWLTADSLRWLKWTSDSKRLTDALRAIPPPPQSRFVTPALNNAIQTSFGNLQEKIPALVESLQTGMQTGRAMGISDTSVSLSLAGQSALDAMDAVCYAEHLNATQTQAQELANARSELHKLTQTVDAIAEERAKRRISVAASKAAIRRHAEHNAMREQVIQHYTAHESTYRSVEAAAAAIAGKVVPVAHRTVVDWIREFKKGRSARRP